MSTSNLDDIFLKALFLRAFDETLLRNFAKLGVRGTTHTSIGQELLPAIVGTLLQREDYVFGNHRSHAIFLSLGGDPTSLYAEILGVQGGVSLGLGGSQHLHFENFYTNGIQGGMAPIAVGASHHAPNDGISVCFLGDGTFGQGVLYESLNLAGILETPTLFVVEDNEMSQSTVTKFVQKGTIRDKIEAFEITTFEGTSRAPDELLHVCQEAFSRVRKDRKPTALLVKQSRLTAHSKGDDNRSKEFLEELWSLDFLNSVLKVRPDLYQAYESYKSDFEATLIQIAQRNTSRDTFIDYSSNNTPSLNTITMERNEDNVRNATYQSLLLALEQNPNLLIFGEDIEWISQGTDRPYGGAFGVTKDLSEKYPKQVRNAPISESGQVGFGIGRALSGKPTIIEIMFGDFTTLIVDQIRQQASKIVSMYGRKVDLPILIRTPMGGRRGYGPTHSQNLEFMFFSIPNVLVYIQNAFFSTSHLRDLLELKMPTIFIEHKDLYNEKLGLIQNPFFSITENLRGNVLIQNLIGERRCLVVSYGYAASLSLNTCIELADENEIFADLLVITLVSPLILDGLEDIIRKYDFLLLVEECDSRAGLLGSLSLELKRLNINATIRSCSGRGDIGSSKHAEDFALLSKEKIRREIVRR